jgi:sporulation protein YlmC with PRC-barrel domain
MRLPALKFVLILVITSSSAYAGEVQRVKLIDGSVMNVEVISMHNGVYTFKSQSLGEFSVNAKQVQSISSLSMPASPAGSANLKLNQLQSTLKAKPGNMKLITGLQNDPDMQAVLSDPNIMKSIQSGDYSALANNPKFQKLMNNPRMKQITNSVTQ